jgi:hypothetical protein
MALGDQAALERRSERTDGQARAELVGQPERDPEVLAMERELEPERVLVVEHPAAAVCEHPALRRPATERRDDLLDVESGLHRQHDPLGNPEVRAGEDDLVDSLDRLAGADRSDVGDGPAHRRQHGSGALDVPFVAADEDRQRCVAGALAAARDRRVDHREAQCIEAFGESPAARWGDRRAVDDERSLAGAGRDAIRTEEHRLDIRRIGDADHHDVALGGDRGRRVGVARAQVAKLRGPTRGAVPGREREPGADDVRGHGGTHRAKTHEADAIHPSSRCARFTKRW